MQKQNSTFPAAGLVSVPPGSASQAGLVAGFLSVRVVDEDVAGLFRLKGWEINLADYTIRATRAGETGSYGVTFHAADGEFTTLTGRGTFSTVRIIRPAIVEIDRLTAGNWHACCDDPKRERAYQRWLPAERILHE